MNNPHYDDTSIYKNAGIVRTDMYCNACTKMFIGSLDYDVNGTHEIHCPFCDHIHYRVIKDGVITDERYGTDSTTTKTKVEKATWTHQSLKIETSSTSHFLRNRWLNRSDS